MDWIKELWSPIAIVTAAFVIGWGAETAQTFIPRAVALSILAWLQTLPEFAVEAAIAWDQQRDLMIANLTGSLRLLVGLGWPMIFFVHWFFTGLQEKKLIKEIHLERADALGVWFLFISILYFIVILVKGSLNCIDSVILTAIYAIYLIAAMKLPAEGEEEHDLPWVGRQIVKLPPGLKYTAVVSIFVVGGLVLYLSVHPFLDTLQKWSLSLGISTFIFVQWVAPFLSEFPEKVSAFNWARQPNKAAMAVMNMVNSNINQWTMLAAMIPIVFNISLGRYEPVTFDRMHTLELGLTIAQSALGGLLLLDLKFSIWDAAALFVLWAIQFFAAAIVDAQWVIDLTQTTGLDFHDFLVHAREIVTGVYVVWIVIELVKLGWGLTRGHKPAAWDALCRSLADYRASNGSQPSVH